MTAPKLATTRPAALTGRVGQGGDDRIHDVALVQALLGLKRAKGGKMYLSGGNHVTGKLDRDTAVALLQFRLDNRDKNIKQPLARSGPVFNKLAQGQALAVLEGTTTPYKLAALAEPGEAKGETAKLLSAERKVELKAVMKDFISDWGIALDVEIKVAANNRPARTERLRKDYESLPLVAHFTPRGLSVHNGRTLSSVSNNNQFQARANIERFWQDNLIEPKSKTPGVNEAVEAITNGSDVGNQAFDDHWVRGIPSKALDNWLKSMFDLEVDPLSGSLGFGAGGSNVTSSGAFFLKRTGNRIVVTVSVRHIWSDPGFDFNKDQPFREESQVLERHKKAKPFLWEATWDDRITGELEVLDPHSPRARLREIVFEVRPAS